MSIMYHLWSLTAKARTKVARNAVHEENPVAFQVSLPAVIDETTVSVDVLKSILNNMTELYTPTEPGQSVTDYSTNQPLHIHQELCLLENENRDINGNTVGSETMESRREEEREITGGESTVDVTMEKGKAGRRKKGYN